MSIIHDALKKIQTKTPMPTQIVTPQPAATPSPQAQEMPALRTPAAKGPSPILIMAVLIIGAIAALSTFFKIPFDIKQHKQTTPPAAAIATPPAVAQAPAPAQEVPTAQAASMAITAPQAAPTESGPHIEGIMDMGGKRVVLINGNIYEEGQTVNESVITAINPTSVTLTENGTTKILPLNP